MVNVADRRITEVAAAPAAATHPVESTGAARFLRQGALFVLLGLLLYLTLYAGSEQLVQRYAQRNRFYTIQTAPHAHYDHVILGASHAAVFDYEDMNARLEQMTGAKILNLSVVGGGVTVNRLLASYLLAKRDTASVVYVVDSFAFYSSQWNEERLKDTRLFLRAPFDPILAQMLLAEPATRPVALDYVSGFSKINNPDRFAPDVGDDETLRFNTTYRPIQQIDAQRLRYLYPERIDPAVFARYLGQFEELVGSLRSRGIQVTAIKPPVPERFYRMLPDEAGFDAALKSVLTRHGATFEDLSLAANEERFYFNTDHLNRSGVLHLYQNYLRTLLALRS